MQLKVNYFGMLADQTGKKEEKLSLADHTLGHLKAVLQEKYPALNDLPYTVVVNHVATSSDLTLTQGDEIALLPPFSGG